MDYEVHNIEFQNNTLTIEFITTTRARNIPDLGEPKVAIVEVTRIPGDIHIVFSHRRR